MHFMFPIATLFSLVPGLVIGLAGLWDNILPKINGHHGQKTRKTSPVPSLRPTSMPEFVRGGDETSPAANTTMLQDAWDA